MSTEELIQPTFECSYTRRHEFANTLTHGFGLVLSLVGGVFLITLATLRGDVWHILSCSIFALSLSLLYAASTLYHLVRNPRLKHALRIMDHSCIYLLIAGSYTPFTLTVMRGGIGWTLFMVVWAIALVGITIKVFTRYRYGFVSVLIYLVMGWLVVLAIRPTLEVVPVSGVLWLLAGGLAYTGGVLLFSMDRIPYNHALWHLCVMAGSACHYLAVMLYVVPPSS